MNGLFVSLPQGHPIRVENVQRVLIMVFDKNCHESVKIDIPIGIGADGLVLVDHLDALVVAFESIDD